MRKKKIWRRRTGEGRLDGRMRKRDIKDSLGTHSREVMESVFLCGSLRTSRDRGQWQGEAGANKKEGWRKRTEGKGRGECVAALLTGVQEGSCGS